MQLLLYLTGKTYFTKVGTWDDSMYHGIEEPSITGTAGCVFLSWQP